MAVGERVNALYIFMRASWCILHKDSKSFLLPVDFAGCQEGKDPVEMLDSKWKVTAYPCFPHVSEGTPACLQFVGKRGEQIVFERRVETLWNWF